MQGQAAGDPTALGEDIPRVKEFLKWALAEKTHVYTTAESDMWLADYLEDGCFARQKGFDRRAATFFGITSCFPEYKNQLALSYPAYSGWKKLPWEGICLPIELAFCIADRFRSKGMRSHALITETSLDLYLRQEKWSAFLRRQRSRATCLLHHPATVPPGLEPREDATRSPLGGGTT